MSSCSQYSDLLLQGDDRYYVGNYKYLWKTQLTKTDDDEVIPDSSTDWKVSVISECFNGFYYTKTTELALSVSDVFSEINGAQVFQGVDMSIDFTPKMTRKFRRIPNLKVVIENDEDAYYWHNLIPDTSLE